MTDTAPTHLVWLVLGSNLPGEKAVQQVLKAQEMVAEAFDGTVRFSTTYCTPAEGHASGVYANAVGCGQTARGLESLEMFCKECERRLGRTEKTPGNPLIAVDIDVVRYDDTIVRPKNLQMSFMQQGMNELGLHTKD